MVIVRVLQVHSLDEMVGPKEVDIEQLLLFDIYISSGFL
jgi:hypothetical protein